MKPITRRTVPAPTAADRRHAGLRPPVPRPITLRALRHLLRELAVARHATRQARHHLDTAEQALAAATARNRTLTSHLARREAVQLLPVAVPTEADPATAAPTEALVLVLLTLWATAAAERDAFRIWVTEDPLPTSTPALQARAAEASSVAADQEVP